MVSGILTTRVFAVRYSSALRECSLLMELKHRAIVELLDVAITKSAIVLVFELLARNLREFLRDCDKHRIPFDLATVRFSLSLLFRLLCSAHYYFFIFDLTD